MTMIKRQDSGVGLRAFILTLHHPTPRSKIISKAMPDVSLNTSVDDHMSSARLPIVDISPYLTAGASQAEKEATQKSLDSACREFGTSLSSLPHGP